MRIESARVGPVTLGLAALIFLSTLFGSASAAFAHGGRYQGGSGNGNSPIGHQIPPDIADRADRAGRTRTWEAYWIAYKDNFLHLADRVRSLEDSVVTGTKMSAKERRVLREILVREQLVPLFLRALQDKNAEVRSSAAIALGKSRDPRGTAPLMAGAKKDKDDGVRASCIIALGISGDEMGLPLLDSVLCDPTENNRRRAFAAISLGLVGGEDAAAGLVRFATERIHLWKTGAREKQRLLASTYVGLGLTGSRLALNTLRDALMDDRKELQLRAHAALALGQAGDREALDYLTKLLGEPSQRALFRRTVAMALRDLVKDTDTKPLQVLIRAATSTSDAVVRDQATLSLGHVRCDAARQALRKRFSNAPDMELPGVALALGIQGDTGSAVRIRKQFEKTKDARTRSAYALALGLLGDDASVPLLLAELNSPLAGRAGPTSARVVLALALMDSQESRDPLFELMKSTKSPTLAVNTAVALALLGDPRSRETLLEWLDKKRSIRERAGAAVTLGILRMVEAAKPLMTIFEDKNDDPTVRAFALVGLGFLGDPSEVPRLSRLATHGGYAMPLEPLDELLSIL